MDYETQIVLKNVFNWSVRAQLVLHKRVGATRKKVGDRWTQVFLVGELCSNTHCEAGKTFFTKFFLFTYFIYLFICQSLTKS